MFDPAIISSKKFENLQQEIQGESQYPVRGLAVKNELQKYGSVCGSNLKVGFGVLFHYSKCNYRIGEDVEIGHYCILGWGDDAPESIILEDSVKLGDYTSVTARMNTNTMGVSQSPILIKKGAVIGRRVTLVPGISIGENAFVCTGSIVESDIPDNAVAEGRPAKVTGYLEGKSDE